MKLSEVTFLPHVKYRVYFYFVKVLKAELFHPDDDFPMFAAYADGFPHLFDTTVVVVGCHDCRDEYDQQVQLAVIPRRDVFKIVPLKPNQPKGG